MLCCIPPVTPESCPVCLDVVFPRVPAWTRSRLNPYAVAWLARELDFFDGPCLVSMAFNGVRFRASGLPSPGRPAYANRFVDDVAGNSAEVFFRETLLPKMLRLGHCRLATPLEESLAVVHAISLIPKSVPGTFRMIHDLTCGLLDVADVEHTSFNESTPHQFLPRTALTTIEQIVEVLCELAALGFKATIHLASVDLEQAYYQIHLADGESITLGFSFDGSIYLFMGLPFGSKASPSIFCRFVNLIWSYLRGQRVMIFWYIDDGCIIAITLEECLRAVALTLRTLEFVGFAYSAAKSVLVPTRRLDYIGVEIDVDEWVLRLLPRHVSKLQAHVDLLLSVKVWRASDLFKALDKFTGLLNFSETVIPLLAPLKAFFIGVKLCSERRGRAPYSLSKEAVFHLETVRALSVSRNARPIRSRAERLLSWSGCALYSDACNDSPDTAGFGAWFRDSNGAVFYLYGLFKDAPVDLRHLHINDLELLAHVMALTLLLPEAGCVFESILSHIDNKCALSWLNNFTCSMNADVRSTRWRRLRFLRQLALALDSLDLDVSVDYVPSADNVHADDLSRGRVAAFCAVFPHAVQVSLPMEWWRRWTRAFLP